jgi:hypothetical protein
VEERPFRAVITNVYKFVILSKRESRQAGMSARRRIPRIFLLPCSLRSSLDDAEMLIKTVHTTAEESGVQPPVKELLKISGRQTANRIAHSCGILAPHVTGYEFTYVVPDFYFRKMIFAIK